MGLTVWWWHRWGLQARIMGAHSVVVAQVGSAGGEIGGGGGIEAGVVGGEGRRKSKRVPATSWIRALMLCCKKRSSHEAHYLSNPPTPITTTTTTTTHTHTHTPVPPTIPHPSLPAGKTH
jgi:hypothetical protein